MAIEVTCPNGHHLRVKDKYAGQTGRCPYCAAHVDVPVPIAKDLEDEILSLLGPPQRQATPLSDPDLPVHQEPTHQAKLGEEGSGMSLLSSAVKHKKVCPKCNEQVLFWFATCPHCNTAFPSGLNK